MFRRERLIEKFDDNTIPTSPQARRHDADKLDSGDGNFGFEIDKTMHYNRGSPVVAKVIHGGR